jgi:phosphoribosylformylglycinamidine synthase
MTAIQSQNGVAAVIGKITDDNEEVFEYEGETIATIPNEPSSDILESLKGKTDHATEA